jgi:GNAT superfamily N-acetyltransferase
LTLAFAEFDQRRDLDEQRRLFDSAFPEHRGMAAASVEHYQWKFHGLPARPTSYEYVATEAGRLLGYYAAIPYPYEIAGRSVTAGMVCDVMTHPDARGKGVFTELGRFALAEIQAAGVDFVTGYPVRPEVMGGHLRAGWDVAFEMPMYLRPLRTDAILAARHLGALAGVGNLGVAAYHGLLARGTGGEKYTSFDADPADIVGSASFARFLDAWAGSVPNHLVKSAEFYGWRLGAPGVRYRAFLVQRGEMLVAAAVGRSAVLNGVPSLALLDVMVLPGHEQALTTLYRDLATEARRRRDEAIVTMMSRASARRYRLLRHSFLRSPFVFKLILRSTSASLSVDSLCDERDWHLMWIDSDDL